MALIDKTICKKKKNNGSSTKICFTLNIIYKHMPLTPHILTIIYIYLIYTPHFRYFAHLLFLLLFYVAWHIIHIILFD